MYRNPLRSQVLTHPTIPVKAAIPQSLNLLWPDTEGSIAYEWDIVTGKIEWFGRIAEQFGFASDEFMGTQEAWEKNIHPDDRGLIRSGIYRHLKTGELFLHPYRAWRKDGGFVYVQDLATTLRNRSGTPYKWFGLMRLSDKPGHHEWLIEQAESRDELLNKDSGEVADTWLPNTHKALPGHNTPASLTMFK